MTSNQTLIYNLPSFQRHRVNTPTCQPCPCFRKMAQALKRCYREYLHSNTNCATASSRPRPIAGRRTIRRLPLDQQNRVSPPHLLPHITPRKLTSTMRVLRSRSDCNTGYGNNRPFKGTARWRKRKSSENEENLTATVYFMKTQWDDSGRQCGVH